MNRRQFTQSLGALFAAPALPPISIPTASVATALPPTAYFWAHYLTRMHAVCTPEMLAPFFKSDLTLAKTIHAQLVSEHVLMTSGHPHPNVMAQRANAAQRTEMQQSSKNSKTTEPDDLSERSPAEGQAAPDPADDEETLADIWHTAWHEAHAKHVPDALTKLRTRTDFVRRLSEMRDDTIVDRDAQGSIAGFCVVRGNEIYQLFTAQHARGSGAAQRLIAAGEARIKAAGHTSATLDVIPQNTRAIRFYEKSGWRRDRIGIDTVDTSEGPFELEVLFMVKDLSDTPSPPRA